MSDKKPKEPTFSPEYIRSISELVYRRELARAAGGSDSEWKHAEADRMIAKDNAAGKDGPKLFSNRASVYDHLTRAYLEVLDIKP